MSIKQNIFANFISQTYVTVVGIVMVPMYFNIMGSEAYGLIGFFSMLQAWFQLLDMGLSSTLARETARFNSQVSKSEDIWSLLRILEVIFFIIAIFAMILTSEKSDYIVNNWLKIQYLPISKVEYVVKLMGVIVALRWAGGLYRGAINGFEKFVWLGKFNILVATFRFILVIPVLKYIDSGLLMFFSYQLLMAIIEFILLAIKTYQLMPNNLNKMSFPRGITKINGILKFSLSLWFVGSVWVFVTQSDKLLLSKLLSMSEYAYFSMAVLMASGVSILSGPITVALLPRLTKIAASENNKELFRLYKQATQFVAVIAIPAAMMLALFPEQVLFGWTGSYVIAHRAAAILSLYAIGNGILSLGAFPYYLQFAKGGLKLHLIGSMIFVIFLIPSMIYETKHYGVIGAGIAWASVNAMYFIFWVPLVHRKYDKKLHAQWLTKDIGCIFVMASIGAIFILKLIEWRHERVYLIVQIIGASWLLLLFAAIGSSEIRNHIMALWLKRKAQ